MKLLIILIISFYASSILLGQDNIDSQINNSSKLKSYAFAPMISDTIITESEIQEIPKITGGDIGGQLLLSPISGIIFDADRGSIAISFCIIPFSSDFE